MELGLPATVPGVWRTRRREKAARAAHRAVVGGCAVGEVEVVMADSAGLELTPARCTDSDRAPQYKASETALEFYPGKALFQNARKSHTDRKCPAR